MIMKKSIKIWREIEVLLNAWKVTLRLQESLRCLIQDECICLSYTSSRRIQEIFKPSSRHNSRYLQGVIQDVLQNRLEDIFKTSTRNLTKRSSRRLAIKVFKTSWGTFKKYVRSRFPSFEPDPPAHFVRPCSFPSTHPSPPRYVCLG